MALIAYLMEFKGNYGPHLIIVPNAVLVNWKVGIFSYLINSVLSTLFLQAANLGLLNRVNFIVGYHLCLAFTMLVIRINEQNCFHR